MESSLKTLCTKLPSYRPAHYQFYFHLGQMHRESNQPERTLSLGFLGIIFRVLRLVVFYQVFLLSPLQCTVMHCINCKRLREFEEIEISRQSCRGDFEYQGGKLLIGFCLDFVQQFSLCPSLVCFSMDKVYYWGWFFFRCCLCFIHVFRIGTLRSCCY